VVRRERFNIAGEKEKDFRQRRPDTYGGWIWNKGDPPYLLYRLPELIAYPDATLFVCEGEKDADRLASLGACATTVANGAWPGVDVAAAAGRDVYVLEDADIAGVGKAVAAAHALHKVAKTLRIVRLPGHEHTTEKRGKDISDWLDEDPDRGADDLAEACRHAPLWVPQEVPTALDYAKASAFKMRVISWLWANRFAYGKLGLLGGLPDMGKGLITAFMMACVTKGLPFPCGEGTPRKGSVIYLSAEDDVEDTITPRLTAAGTDLDRVYIVKAVRVAGGKNKTFSLVTDLEALRELVDSIGDVSMIVIDPVASYVGGGKVNTHMNSEVRSFLTPLTDMAAEKRIFVLGVVHLNKKADVTSAILRISDSLAYVAAARHVYVCVNDPEVEGRRLFVKAKNNLSTDNKALSYITQEVHVGHDEETLAEIRAPIVVWGTEHVKVTANEAMQAESAGGASQFARREAREFLHDRLSDGPVKSDDLIEEAKALGISEKTLRRAQKDLKVRAHKPKGKFDGAWVWELPAQATQKDD